MDKIKVNRDELLGRVQTNRDEHRAVFEKAVTGYQAQMYELLHAAIRRIEVGKMPDLYALNRLPVPQDHTSDYDAVLDLLGMAVGPEVEIDEEDFRAYVRDEWRWKREWATTTASYLGG